MVRRVAALTTRGRTPRLVLIYYLVTDPWRPPTPGGGRAREAFGVDGSSLPGSSIPCLNWRSQPEQGWPWSPSPRLATCRCAAGRGWRCPRCHRLRQPLGGGDPAILAWTWHLPGDRSRSQRARIAAERGYRYLQVDASDESRPILRRLGFVALSTNAVRVRALGRLSDDRAERGQHGRGRRLDRPRSTGARRAGGCREPPCAVGRIRVDHTSHAC